MINSRRDDLPKQTAEYLNKNCVMCSVHFEDSMFMNVNERNKLVPGAIPTLVNVPNPPPRSTLKRPAPKERAPPQPKRTKLQDLETVPLHPEDEPAPLSRVEELGIRDYVTYGISPKSVPKIGLL